MPIMLFFMNSKLPDKLVVLRNKTKFFKKVNAIKHPVKTYILMRTWNFIIHVFYSCIPLDHEIYIKFKKNI